MHNTSINRNAALIWIGIGLALTEMSSGSLSYGFSYGYSFLDPQGRYLTNDEIALAQRVYGESLDYKSIRVLERRSFTTTYKEWKKGYKFLGTADRNLIYLHNIDEEDVRLNEKENFKGYPNRKLLIHEIGHVGQYQRNIPNNGDYKTLSLKYESGKVFTGYAFEQQPGIGEAYYSALRHIDQLAAYFRKASVPAEQAGAKMKEVCQTAHTYGALLQPVFGTKPHPACLSFYARLS